MADRRPERLEALRRKLAQAGLDALIVTSLPNIRYLTGFSGSSAIVCVSGGEVWLLTDFRYRVQAAQEAGNVARVTIESGSAWDRLFAQLKDLAGVQRVGYEAQHLTAWQSQRLKTPERPWQFEGTADLVESLRVVKAPEEMDAIHNAASLAANALVEAIVDVRAGQTEFEVAGLLEHALRRNRSEGFPFSTIVASGPRSALPHAGTSERVLVKGDLLLIDFGAIVEGYCSDMTRTFVVGAEPTDEQAAIYALVKAAQDAALGGLRGGLTGRAADALARDVITSGGHGEHFGHSLGHGIGLEVHEGPRLAKTSEEPLPVGAVVTVEPGIYLEGWGGVRIEDDVVLTATGAQLMAMTDRELARTA